MVDRIDIVFDQPPDSPYHSPTVDAVVAAVRAASADLDVRVVGTAEVRASWAEALPAGVMIGPGTPYRDPAAAEEAIRTAREKGIPLVAT